MTAKGQTEVERVAALVDRKLSAMERQEKPPSHTELNAVRRLVDDLHVLLRHRPLSIPRRAGVFAQRSGTVSHARALKNRKDPPAVPGVL